MLWGEEKAHSNTLTHTERVKKIMGRGSTIYGAFLNWLKPNVTTTTLPLPLLDIILGNKISFAHLPKA